MGILCSTPAECGRFTKPAFRISATPRIFALFRCQDALMLTSIIFRQDLKHILSARVRRTLRMLRRSLTAAELLAMMIPQKKSAKSSCLKIINGQKRCITALKQFRILPKNTRSSTSIQAYLHSASSCCTILLRIASTTAQAGPRHARALFRQYRQSLIQLMQD